MCAVYCGTVCGGAAGRVELIIITTSNLRRRTIQTNSIFIGFDLCIDIGADMDRIYLYMCIYV